MYELVKSIKWNGEISVEHFVDSHKIKVTFDEASLIFIIDKDFVEECVFYPPDTRLETVDDYVAATDKLADYLADIYTSSVTSHTIDFDGVPDFFDYLPPRLPTLKTLMIKDHGWGAIEYDLVDDLLDNVQEHLHLECGVHPQSEYNKPIKLKTLISHHTGWFKFDKINLGSLENLVLIIRRNHVPYMLNVMVEWMRGEHPKLHLYVIGYKETGNSKKYMKKLLSGKFGIYHWTRENIDEEMLSIAFNVDDECAVLKRETDGMEVKVYLNRDFFAFRVLNGSPLCLW